MFLKFLNFNKKFWFFGVSFYRCKEALLLFSGRERELIAPWSNVFQWAVKNRFRVSIGTIWGNINCVWQKTFQSAFHFEPWAEKGGSFPSVTRRQNSQKPNSICRKEHIKENVFLWKPIFTNPEKDLNNFKLLTKFYLRGCHTCVPIDRRNVPKKNRFYKM